MYAPLRAWGGLVKALTLHQPWASLCAIGAKRVETRSWPTQYRGPLAIHSARVSSEPGLEAVLAALGGEEGEAVLFQAARFLVESRVYQLGAVIAVVDLVSCEQMTAEMIDATDPVERALGDWRPGRYAWRFENPRHVDPVVPARGAQRLWEVAL